MTKPKPPADRLDANSVGLAAASLAAHLQRSGVHWLPKPCDASVDALAQSMAGVGSDEPGDPPAAEPAPQAASNDNRPSSIRPTTRLDPVAPVQSADLISNSGDSYPGDLITIDQRQSALDVIQGEVADCTKCEVLSSCRNNTVFGEGSVSPRVAFFGEGPGADEDRLGRPFVGKAGQLLTKMIEACTFKREEVYIFNTVKCRPPGNRNPEPDEISNCRDFYERQLAVLRPEYIVCLGAVSAQELLKSKLSVGRLRGKLHQHFESKVLVTYHPAYLLRNPAAKKAAWADLQLLLRDAGIRI